MEHIISESIAKYGLPGVLVLLALWIVCSHLKDFIKGEKGDKSSQVVVATQQNNEYLISTIISSLTTKMENIVNRIDNMENNFSQRINSIESQLHSQPDNIINLWDARAIKKDQEHNKMMEDQMKLGPELHNILLKHRGLINCDHIFLGSFHNGNTNISGIPYCKFDIIAEKFSPNKVERDIEYAFMYKDADILRHDKLPITVLQNEMVHYTIDPNGNSELAEIDDIIYRRMIGRDIKQLAVHITRDGEGKPSGFVGCVKYDYSDMNLNSLKNCAKELEIIYRNAII
jgi:hypothetical protein